MPVTHFSNIGQITLYQLEINNLFLEKILPFGRYGDE